MSATVVVPTFDEADNVGELVLRIVRLGVVDELIFVDDSLNDKTIKAIEKAANRLPSSCDLVVRSVWRRGVSRQGGLSGAVVDGIKNASKDIVLVMDGDLQHPPETIPYIIAAMKSNPGIIVASRYCGDGSSEGLGNKYRSLVSRSSTLLAKACFPRKLHGVTDPMTGFFAVRRRDVDLQSLSPRGFKILLELIVTHPNLKVTEVAFRFGERHANESKTSAKVGITFLTQILHLQLRRITPTY